MFGDFMLDFDAIKNVNTEKIKYDKNSDILISNFNLALENINKFNNLQDRYNKKYLLLAARYFSDCLKIKSNFAEAYLGLAYTFFIIDDISNAFKYIKLAEEFEPDSQIIKELKEKVVNKLKF